VVINQGIAEAETPRAASIREAAERHAAAVETLNNDPEVIKLKAIFDANLDENSVQPIVS
jgi:DNA polymerase-3 subunit gamma/tau